MLTDCLMSLIGLTLHDRPLKSGERTMNAVTTDALWMPFTANRDFKK